MCRRNYVISVTNNNPGLFNSCLVSKIKKYFFNNSKNLRKIAKNHKPYKILSLGKIKPLN